MSKNENKKSKQSSRQWEECGYVSDDGTTLVGCVSSYGIFSMLKRNPDPQAIDTLKLMFDNTAGYFALEVYGDDDDAFEELVQYLVETGVSTKEYKDKAGAPGTNPKDSYRIHDYARFDHAKYGDAKTFREFGEVLHKTLDLSEEGLEARFYMETKRIYGEIWRIKESLSKLYALLED